MKGMILAAGLGTRLKPLTDTKPKALIDVGGYTLLELAIRYLKKYGIKDIIINLHHFPEQIIQYVREHRSFDINIEFSDESSGLLDTGGAIQHASEFLKGKGPFVLMAVDILTNLDLSQMIASHKKKGSLVTLAVKKRETSRSLIFNQEMHLTGWKNNQTGEVKGNSIMNNSIYLGFSGIHLIEPSIFDLISEEGTFSIIDLYLRLMKAQIIHGFLDEQSTWLEFGRLHRLQEIIQGNDFQYLVKTL
jgi:NDP-sugar pyrophosphorylase family protein